LTRLHDSLWRTRPARRGRSRRQELLARRDDRQPRCARRQRAGRLRDHGARLPRLPRARRPRRAHQGELAALDVDDVAPRRDRRANPRLDSLDAVPGAPRSRRSSRATSACAKAAIDVAVAVRSSATAEDLPEASFAGQQETLLNVRGRDTSCRRARGVRLAVQRPRDRLSRAPGLRHSQVALSAGIQHMVRSDLGASGVMFTLDTDSGFRDVVFITASYGLGETVVQGAVNPTSSTSTSPRCAPATSRSCAARSAPRRSR
jgi:hypothetical protein